MNIAARLTLASTWIPVTADVSRGIHGHVANTFSSLIKLPGQQEYGLVLTGWDYSGFDTINPAPEPVSIQLLAAGGQGLYDATANYINDAVTNGAGSVVVADFNQDGKPDIFLAAHNESPFLPLPSTVYMSTSGTGYEKLVLPDGVTAHDASLIQINGAPAVLASTYMGMTSPLYLYQNGKFVMKEFPTRYGTDPGVNTVLSGVSSVVDSFDGSGKLQLVRGDIMYYNADWTAPVASNIAVFSYNSDNSINQTPLQVITPYLSTLPQYQHIVSLYGPGLTHAYRLYTEDLNHDGFMDVMVGQAMWEHGNDDWPSALQILINDGTGRFEDKTEALNPSMSLAISALDYTPSMVDIDASGINTYLFAGINSLDSSRQSNYVLLNDGTGKLYVGMHDEFHELNRQVNEFVKGQFQESDGFQMGGFSQHPGSVAKFIGVPQANGSINFVAQTEIVDFRDALNPQAVYVHTNVEVEYNPTVDFTQDVSIVDRNHSQLIRTWAGNDTIYDTNAAVSTSINGGLGFDTVVYSTAAANATVARTADGFQVDRGEGKTDTLAGIERLVFTDQSIELPSIIDGFNPLAIYRFYNNETGAHFYTASVHEAENVLSTHPSFSFEGVAFERAAQADSSAVDVHRFYNTVSGVHFYTASQEEADQVVATLPEYSYEGVAYYAHADKVAGTTELYRFYNPHTGAHFYTASADEMESVRINLAGSFNYEGVAYYVDIV